MAPSHSPLRKPRWRRLRDKAVPVHTVHPSLLIGPSDWQSERMPESEFTRRIDRLWQAHPTATRAIVYGSPRHHAELAYLTNLVPKLEAAVALLTRDTEPKLFLGGG